jgi:hypothetical protein
MRLTIPEGRVDWRTRDIKGYVLDRIPEALSRLAR